MKKSQADAFEKLTAQLDSLHSELTTLAKKAPNDAVNEFKLRFVNATIAQCNRLLGEKYKPFADFATFASEALPSNSDVTFIISQYLECAEKMRADHVYQYHSSWYWRIEGEPRDSPTMRTAPPRKLTRKD